MLTPSVAEIPFFILPMVRVSTVILKKKDIILILPLFRFVGMNVFTFAIIFAESVR